MILTNTGCQLHAWRIQELQWNPLMIVNRVWASYISPHLRITWLQCHLTASTHACFFQCFLIIEAHFQVCLLLERTLSRPVFSGLLLGGRLWHTLHYNLEPDLWRRQWLRGYTWACCVRGILCFQIRIQQLEARLYKINNKEIRWKPQNLLLTNVC